MVLFAVVPGGKLSVSAAGICPGLARPKLEYEYDTSDARVSSPIQNAP